MAGISGHHRNRERVFSGCIGSVSQKHQFDTGLKGGIVCRAPANVLSATRQLLQPDVTDIEAYLDRAFVTNWSALFRMGKVDQG